MTLFNLSGRHATRAATCPSLTTLSTTILHMNNTVIWIGVLDHCRHREKVNSSGMTCSPILVNHIQ